MITFRKLVEADFNACLSIFQENYPDVYSPNDLRIDISDVLNKAYASDFLVALRDDIIIGFGCQHIKKPNLFRISWVNITPKEQGKGIGRDLVLELEKIVRIQNKQFFQIILETDKPIFYNKLGYTTHSQDGNKCHMIKFFRKKLF